MNREEFMSEIEKLYADPALSDCFSEIQHCLMMLKVFQFTTIGIMVLLTVRFRTFGMAECWRVNRALLFVFGFILSGMVIYEIVNYECMSSGRDGVPIGFQLLVLLAVVYFYYQKKE